MYYHYSVGGTFPSAPGPGTERPVRPQELASSRPWLRLNYWSSCTFGMVYIPGKVMWRKLSISLYQRKISVWMIDKDIGYFEYNYNIIHVTAPGLGILYNDATDWHLTHMASYEWRFGLIYVCKVFWLCPFFYVFLSDFWTECFIIINISHRRPIM